MWRAAVLDRVYLLDKRTLWVAVLTLLHLRDTELFLCVMVT